MKNFLKNLWKLLKIFTAVFTGVLFIGFAMILSTLAINEATEQVVDYWQTAIYFVGAVTCVAITMTMLIRPLFEELKED